MNEESPIVDYCQRIELSNKLYNFLDEEVVCAKSAHTYKHKTIDERMHKMKPLELLTQVQENTILSLDKKENDNMGFKDTFKNIFMPFEDEDYMENTTENILNKVQMALYEPRSFEEVELIAHGLKAGKAVIVNLHRLKETQAQRVIDFLSGVTIAIDGSIKEVGESVILCTPMVIDIDGDINFKNKLEE